MLINDYKKESREKRHRSHPQADRRDGRAAAPGGLPQRAATSTRRSIDDVAHADARARLDARRGRSRRRSTGRRRRDAAKKVGAAIAKRCLAKGIDKVVFDRNGYIYHGRVTALADGAREAGLKF